MERQSIGSRNPADRPAALSAPTGLRNSFLTWQLSSPLCNPSSDLVLRRVQTSAIGEGMTRNGHGEVTTCSLDSP